MSLISVMAFLPEGLFIDNIAKHMKTELAQVNTTEDHNTKPYDTLLPGV